MKEYFPLGVFDKWLAIPSPLMATVTAWLFNSDKSAHLLGNLSITI